MHAQMERMVEKKKGFFKWKKFAFGKSEHDKMEQELEGNGMYTPADLKTRLVNAKGSSKNTHKWRKSMS